MQIAMRQQDELPMQSRPSADRLGGIPDSADMSSDGTACRARGVADERSDDSENCVLQELVKLKHTARYRNYAIQNDEQVSDQNFGGFCGRISAICPIFPVGDAIGDL